jgi:hypothetical protein
MNHICHSLEAESGFLFGRAEGIQQKELICKQLETCPANTVLILSFKKVKFIDVSCADEVVTKVVGRIQSGEFPNRFIILDEVKPQHQENIEMSLSIAKKSVFARQDGKWMALGELSQRLRDIADLLVQHGSITARQLFELLDFDNINESSTKLCDLYKHCLIGREPDRQPAKGGGTQFRYVSLMDQYE